MIHQWHLARGWKGIGYHFVIRMNGEIEEGRPHWAQGAHVKGYNHLSIGIALAGNFETHEPTPEQISSLVELIFYLWETYPDAKVVAHRHLAATLCPGKYFPWAELQERLREKEKGEDSLFPDVSRNKWYYGVVQEAVKLGLMKGYGDGTFKPEQAASRAELAAVAVRQYYQLNFQDDIKRVIAENRPRCVTIYREKGGGGSGVLISKDTVLTNAHVVDHGGKLTVVSNDTNNEWKMPGEVLKQGATWDDNQIPHPIVPHDKIIDLALVKLAKPVNVEPVKWRDEPPEDGEYIIVIGSPLLIRGWASDGIISRHTKYFWNTSAPINPGNSGGGAFNLKGEFIGTPTYKYVLQGVDCMAGIIRAKASRLWIDGKYDQIEF